MAANVIIRTRAVRGVNSDGFITIVHPAANAGATFHALIDELAMDSQNLKGTAYHILIG
jgi:hypothetical protein